MATDHQLGAHGARPRVRLLDNLAPGSAQLNVTGVVDAPGVTHLTYQIVRHGQL
ncbi:MAG: hypothetical protein ACRDP5_07105 [Streptosporangiaceae bacterium]